VRLPGRGLSAPHRQERLGAQGGRSQLRWAKKSSACRSAQNRGRRIEPLRKPTWPPCSVSRATREGLFFASLGIGAPASGSS